jgi:nitrogen regulatory protein PII
MTSRLVVRKLITVICESCLEEPITKAAKETGASGFTVSDARGSGTHGLRDGSWPENANIRIEILCDEAIATRILDLLIDMYYVHYKLVTFVTDVGVIRPKKFQGDT